MTGLVFSERHIAVTQQKTWILLTCVQSGDPLWEISGGKGPGAESMTEECSSSSNEDPEWKCCLGRCHRK